MKKIVFSTFFLSLLFLFRVSGQTDFRFGLQTSPTITWFSTNDQSIAGNGSNLGIKIGLVSEFFITENYALVTGVGLSFNQGGTLQHNQGGNFWPNSDLSDGRYYLLNDGINLKYDLQYLDIPFSLRMRTREFGYLRYFAEIPVLQVSILTQARGSTEGFAGGDTEKEYINKDVNPLGVSWGFGAGVEYSLSTTSSIMGGIFYKKGILDVTRNKNAEKYKFDDQGYPIPGEAVKEDANVLLNSICLRIALMF